ncbi:hypothetical protein [Streptomyces sp. NPDC002666]
MTTDRKRGWWEEHREILPPKLPDLAEIGHTVLCSSTPKRNSPSTASS